MSPVWRQADVARRGEIHGLWNLESNRIAGLRTLAEMRECHRSEGHEQHRGRPPRQPRSFRRPHLGRAVEQQIHVADVAQSLLRIFLETALDQWPHPRRDGVPRRLGGQDRGDRVGGGGAVERTAAAHHFIDHRAEGPDVGALVDGLASRLFRRHVSRGADDRARARGRLGGRIVERDRGARLLQFREAEVEHLDAAVGSDLDVGRFQIAVDDPAIVRRPQRRGDLRRDGKSFVDRHRRAAQAFRQRLAVDQLHDQVVGADVVERADVRMVQRGDRPRFAREPIAELFGRDLDRDVASEPRIARAIHLAHAARTNALDNLVRAQPRPWRHRTESLVQFGRNTTPHGRSPTFTLATTVRVRNVDERDVVRRPVGREHHVSVGGRRDPPRALADLHAADRGVRRCCR